MPLMSASTGKGGDVVQWRHPRSVRAPFLVGLAHWFSSRARSPVRLAVPRIASTPSSCPWPKTSSCDCCPARPPRFVALSSLTRSLQTNRDTPDDQKYTVAKKLGEGGFSAVCKVVRTCERQSFAMKAESAEETQLPGDQARGEGAQDNGANRRRHFRRIVERGAHADDHMASVSIFQLPTVPSVMLSR